MSRGRSTDNPFIAGIEDIRSSWGWSVAIGILLMLFGVVCIVVDVTATFATVPAFGWLLLLGGIVAFVQAFRTRTWSGFFLYLLSALLRGFTGYLLIRYPTSEDLSFSLILASFFIVGGVFRAIGAGTLQFPRWGWSAFGGMVSVLLGILLLGQMPASSVWFIGFAIGTDLFMDGSSLVVFATAIHSMPNVAAYRTS